MDTQFKMRYRVLVNSADASKYKNIKIRICNVASYCHLRFKKQNNIMVNSALHINDIYLSLLGLKKGLHLSLIHI